jgi:hypothetical protein
MASPILHSYIWPKLSTLLFGKEQRSIMYSHSASDVREWEHAIAGNVFWVFSIGPGVTEDDIGDVRAVVLTAANHPGPDGDGAGGVLFTVEEMGETDKAAWKTAWTVLPPPICCPWPGDAGESDADLAMERKNGALCRVMAGLVTPQLSSKKEIFESI